MSFNLEALPEQIREAVKVIDKGDRIELQHGYLEDKALFDQIYNVIVAQFHGKYFGYYGEAAHYEIPKNKIDEAFKPQLPERADDKELEPPEGFKKATELQAEEEYDIKDSIPHVGYLYPILKDAHGNVIDGFHRLALDPNWPVKKLDHITDPVQLEMARLIANSFRRGIPASEKTERLRHIAKMTGWDAKKLAENLPLSYRTVLTYLPDELKDATKVEAGRIGGLKSAAKLAPKSEDTRQGIQWVHCEGEGCNIQTTYKPERVVNGKLLCLQCYRKITEQEPPQKPPRIIDTPSPEVTQTIQTPKEAWTNRVTRRYRATVHMKKPWTFTSQEPTAHTPTKDEVLETFANDILDFNLDIDEFFEITIETEAS